MKPPKARHPARARAPFWSLRGLAFRLGAVGLGLFPFVLLELFLVVVDWGRPSAYEDPFAGFRAVTPLFELRDDGTRYEIAEGRQRFFRPDSFLATRPPDGYRIFCLGGSTVQGRPFAIETAFPTWLKLSLEAAAPQRPFEVVNCGGISYASYRLTAILDEVLEYEPDLIVIYCGHNEFLEDRTYDHIKHMPSTLAGPLELLSRLRTFTLLRAGYLRLKGEPSHEFAANRPLLEAEVDARLDHPGGLQEYHRDPKWRKDVIAHYGHALRQMVDRCRAASITVLLVNPVSNSRDCPPFKSEHRSDLSADDLAKWKSLRQDAGALYRTNKRRAIFLLEEAVRIDAEHAGSHYDLAKILDAAGQLPRARALYEHARELDVCPLRMLEAMHEAVLEIAEETGTPLLDVRALIEGLSDDGIPGNDWLVDHVHPSIRGHKVIAAALAEKIAELGVVELGPGWETRREKSFEAHYASLDDLYFVRGMNRLEGLRAWAQGRVEPTLLERETETGDSGRRRRSETGAQDGRRERR